MAVAPPATAAATLARVYLHASIARSTRSGYQATTDRYFAYLRARPDRPRLAIDTQTVCEWFAELAHEGRVAAVTISGYRSALSTAYIESDFALSNPRVPNPLAHEQVRRTLHGISNLNAGADRLRLSLAPRSDALTVGMLDELHNWATESHRHRMYHAALSLTLCAGLRPSELLGSDKLRERALRISQLAFYSDVAGLSRMHAIEHPPLRSGAAHSEDEPLPDHCVLTLLVSKTNQRGERSERKPVGHWPAVFALWRWAQIRAADGTGTAELFRLPGSQPLRTRQLMASAQAALRALGHYGLVLTGKCGRIGAASALAAAGAAEDDIRNVGGWAKRSRVWQVYATPAARLARALDADRTRAAPADRVSSSDSPIDE